MTEFVELEPVEEFIAPEVGKKQDRATQLDLREVERLAEIGMKPQAIGPCLGLSVHQFRKQFERKRVVREAYERGNARWQKSILERMATGKHGVVADIFALKQSHGANWSDHVVTTTDTERNKAAQGIFEARRKKVTALPEAPKLINRENATDADISGDRGGVEALPIRSEHTG